MPPDVQDLMDRQALRDLVAAYAGGCDRRDGEAVAGTFIEDGRLAKYTDPAAQGEPVWELRGRAAIAQTIAALDRYAVTMHFVGQQTVVVDGDQATGETYCLAHHHYVHDGEWFDRVLSIRYLDRYRRVGPDWLIEDRRLVTDAIEYRPVGSLALAPAWAADQDGPSLRPTGTGEVPAAGGGAGAGDTGAIANLVSESHYLVDTGRWAELTDEVFALEEDGLVPEADFGYAVWRGVEGLQAGFGASMPRFAAAVHAVTNLHISVEGDRGTARYYVQGWHWFAPEPGAPAQPAERNADFLVLGIMTDEVVRQRGRWRVLRRQLVRLGPGMAVGAGRPWLQGLGQGAAT